MTRELFDPLDLELRRMLRDLNEGPPAPRDVRVRLRGALALGGGPFPPDGSGAEGALPRSIATRSVPQNVGGAGLAKTATHVGKVWALGGAGTAALIGGWFALGAHGGDRSSHPRRHCKRTSPSRARRTGICDRTARGPALGGRSRRRTSGVAGRGSRGSGRQCPVRGLRNQIRKARSRFFSCREQRLLDAARAALVAGDSVTGLDRLARHARTVSPRHTRRGTRSADGRCPRRRRSLRRSEAAGGRLLRTLPGKHFRPVRPGGATSDSVKCSSSTHDGSRRLGRDQHNT